MSGNMPIGEEQEFEFKGSAAVDGAPIAYLIVLAAVVVALSFFPMSVILVTGGSFPMSQGILGLVGWILGPIAGAIASGIGALIAVFLAPHTAGPIPVIRVLGAMIGSFAAGTMAYKVQRKSWWFWIWLLAIISFLYYIGRAILLNGVGIWTVLIGSFIDWSSILLFLPPSRTIIAGWIASKNQVKVVSGLALGTWIVYGLTHVISSAFYYHLYNWPEVQWIAMSPLMPFENLLRAAIGVIIGGGVIAGLRAIGLKKPEHGIY